MQYVSALTDVVWCTLVAASEVADCQNRIKACFLQWGKSKIHESIENLIRNFGWGLAWLRKYIDLKFQDTNMWYK